MATELNTLPWGLLPAQRSCPRYADEVGSKPYRECRYPIFHAKLGCRNAKQRELLQTTECCRDCDPNRCHQDHHGRHQCED